jgi:hypothetical protein
MKKGNNSMAALWWHNEVRNLEVAYANIGELRDNISVELGQQGFTNIQRNQLEVAGGKGASWVSIAHFHIGDRRFFEVVMCGSDNSNNAKQTVDGVVAFLRNLRVP